MASRIPIRPSRTFGAENDSQVNPRPTQAPVRARTLGRVAPLATSSNPAQRTKGIPAAGAESEKRARQDSSRAGGTKKPAQAALRARNFGPSNPYEQWRKKMGVAAGAGSGAAASSASAASGKIKSGRAAELEAAGSAKRKRQALQELAVRKNVHVDSANGRLTASAEKRRILGMPGKPMGTVASRAPLQKISAGPNVTARTSDAAAVRRLSSRPSLIPVRQRDIDAVIDDADTEEVVVDLDADAGADDTEPLAKRQRTSSVGPEDVLSEAEIADELAAGAFTSPPPHTSDHFDAGNDEEEADSADVECAEWEDLDAADHDDPMMASEYVADIQRYLKECELANLPSPTYMASQPSLTWAMRALLNDWLLQVHTRFHLLPETLFLCVSLIDRFLSLRAVPPAKLQLVGLACLLVACKFEETICPAICNFVQIAGDACKYRDSLPFTSFAPPHSLSSTHNDRTGAMEPTYSEAQIREAERHLLGTLEWGVSVGGGVPGVYGWLRRCSKAEGYQTQTRQLAKYLAEIMLVEHRLVGTPPSLLAAAALWLARVALGEGEWVPKRKNGSSDAADPDSEKLHDDDGIFTLWPPTLAHYATYPERALLPTAGHMLRYVLKPVEHESFHRKWAGKKNMKVSIYMREWALTRWDEGTVVDLASELPALREEVEVQVRVRRAREAEAGVGSETAGEAEEE
ncbi:cyclin-like protein [Mycena galopus ATCC 62051]|nr:cyclin-like protein [Mycena galopus ATCC 62051]